LETKFFAICVILNYFLPGRKFNKFIFIIQTSEPDQTFLFDPAKIDFINIKILLENIRFIITK